MKRYLYLIAFGLIISLKICGQDSITQSPGVVKSDSTLTWVNLGVGGLVAGVDAEGLMAGSISVSFQKMKHIITLKSIYYAQEIMGGDMLSSFDVMYGLIYKKPSWYCSLSSGIDFSYLSVPDYARDYQYSRVESQKIGIPLNFEIFATGMRAGIGINGFLVFNNEYTSYGALLCLQLGRLR